MSKNTKNQYYIPSERRLAAIMFTDIVGYTALMQENESVAASKLSDRFDYRKGIKHFSHIYSIRRLSY